MGEPVALARGRGIFRAERAQHMVGQEEVVGGV